MSKIMNGQQLGCLICDALGIEVKDVRRIEIVCDPGEVAVVRIEKLVRREQATALWVQLQDFRVEKISETEPEAMQ